MKLYATIYSPESSRPSKKGSNDQLKVTLHFGNKPIGTLEFYTTNGKNYKLYYNDKFIEEGGEEKGETKKGEKCDDCGGTLKEHKSKKGYLYCFECWGQREPKESEL